MSSFSLVLPFCTDLSRLWSTLELIELEAYSHGIEQVLLCHNGDRLEADSIDALLRRFSWAAYHHTAVKGLGAGWKLGLANATCDYIILSASDLPFGFTDITAVRELLVSDQVIDLAIGSKWHPHSRVSGYSLRRRAASLLFWMIRRCIIGSNSPRDSQGTLIVNRAILPLLDVDALSNGYLFSLELIVAAAKKGLSVVEVPVTFIGQGRDKSSVRLLSDGFAMLLGLARLASRTDSGSGCGKVVPYSVRKSTNSKLGRTTKLTKSEHLRS